MHQNEKPVADASAPMSPEAPVRKLSRLELAIAEVRARKVADERSYRELDAARLLFEAANARTHETSTALFKAERELAAIAGEDGLEGLTHGG